MSLRYDGRQRESVFVKSYFNLQLYVISQCEIHRKDFTGKDKKRATIMFRQATINLILCQPPINLLY